MSPKEVPKSFYEKYENFGYSRVLIQAAYEACTDPNNENLMLDTIFKIQNDNEMLLSSAVKVASDFLPLQIICQACSHGWNPRRWNGREQGDNGIIEDRPRAKRVRGDFEPGGSEKEEWDTCGIEEHREQYRKRIGF